MNFRGMWLWCVILSFNLLNKRIYLYLCVSNTSLITPKSILFWLSLWLTKRILVRCFQTKKGTIGAWWSVVSDYKSLGIQIQQLSLVLLSNLLLLIEISGKLSLWIVILMKNLDRLCWNKVFWELIWTKLKIKDEIFGYKCYQLILKIVLISTNQFYKM